MIGADSPRRARRGPGRRMAIALFLLPALILYAIFVLFPIVQAVHYSFFKWNGLTPLTDFVGLANYQRALAEPVFQGAVQHNLLIIVLSLIVQIPFALGLALMLSRRFRGRAILRLVFFAPYVIAEVITGVVWSLLLQPSGLADGLLHAVGLGSLYQPWLADPSTVMLAMFFVISWKYFGFHMILLLAGLQGIPHELEEAAAIDGATRRQAIRYVTLPLLGPTLRVSVFLSIIGALQLFDLIWVTTGGGPVNASNTMATYMFDWGFKRFQLGLWQRGRRDPLRVRPDPRPGLSALGAPPGHRGRHDDRGRVAMATPVSTPTTETATRPMTAAARPPVPTAIRLRRLTSAVVRYGFLLLVAAVIIVPVGYAVLGGFKDPAQLANDPIGLPNPWVTSNYTDTLELAELLAAAGQQHDHRGPVDGPGRPVRGPCRVRLRPPDISRARGPVHAVHARPAVPGGRRDPAPVHPRPRPRTARQPARDRPARGGVRPAADDRHPAALLPEHPERARGRRVDRRLRVIRASSGGSSCRSRGRSSRRSGCWPSSRRGTSSCSRS